MKARDQLLALKDAPDPFATPPSELTELRLEAARELFGERRAQVPLLNRMARENDVAEIASLHDLVPLLFSHTSYKSYPHAFLKGRQWGRMQQWLAMVSTRSPVDVDTAGVEGIDDWIGRLWQAGHMVATTSATSGKVSLLPRNSHDHAITRDFVRRLPGWPEPIQPDNSRHFFLLGPKGGSYVAAFMGEMIADDFGRPDSRHFLSNERLKVADVSRMAEFRTRMADGRATPGEISDMEKRTAAQSALSSQRLDEILDIIIAVRHEPMYIIGLWGQLWALMQRAHERGIRDREFHPDTMVSTGGGAKGVSYPSDYQEQILAFLGPVKTLQSYGMSEMSWFQPRCPANRFHQVPWIIPLLLNRSGEALLEGADGVVEGRFGFLDLSFDGRWGGLISGDKVQTDHGPCPCGREGPTVLPTISRYSDVGDDRIGCAGTIDSYVRGSLEQ